MTDIDKEIPCELQGYFLDAKHFATKDYVIKIVYDKPYKDNVKCIIEGYLQFDILGRPYVIVREVLDDEEILNFVDITTPFHLQFQQEKYNENIYLLKDDKYCYLDLNNNDLVSSGIYHCCLIYKDGVFRLVAKGCDSLDL